MIERIGSQAGDGAREGASCTDRTIRSFAIRDGGIERSTPDNTMLGGIGYTQSSDVSVPGGAGRRNGSNRLGGDSGYNEGTKSDIIAVDSVDRIGGIGADMIERIGGQAGDGTGEGAGCADRTIRGFAIRGSRIG